MLAFLKLQLLLSFWFLLAVFGKTDPHTASFLFEFN